MANKTIDRKKAIAARSQSARVGAQSASSRASSPTIDEEEQAGLKADSAALLDEEEEDEMAESEEEEDEEAEESDSADEAEAEEEEEEDEEESRALEKAEERRVARRERREQGVLAVNPQDYAIHKSSGSRLPDNTLVRFVRSSYRELLMVTWPTRQETWSWSLVVVAVSAFVAILLGAADLGLSKFVEWWISLAH